jgi:hypothetical protein
LPHKLIHPFKGCPWTIRITSRKHPIAELAPLAHQITGMPTLFTAGAPLFWCTSITRQLLAYQQYGMTMVSADRITALAATYRWRTTYPVEQRYILTVCVPKMWCTSGRSALSYPPTHACEATTCCCTSLPPPPTHNPPDHSPFDQISPPLVPHRPPSTSHPLGVAPFSLVLRSRPPMSMSTHPSARDHREPPSLLIDPVMRERLAAREDVPIQNSA